MRASWWSLWGMGLALTWSGLLWAQSAPPGVPPAPPSPPPMTAEQAAQITPLLEAELARLQGGLPWLKLVLLNTDDPLYRGYMSVGIFKVSDATFSRQEQGMASAAIAQGKVNGQEQPVCYVLYRPEQGGYLYQAFVTPLTAVASAQSAAAFLVAHEVGHCLDQLERAQSVGAQMVWKSSEVAPLGLAPAAVERVFGPTMASGTYGSKIGALAADSAQAQYGERVADAFGVLWVWRLGGSEKVRDALREQRARLPAWDTHATAPVLDLLDAYKAPLAQTEGVAGIWALARQAQLAAGVDPSLGPGSTHALNPLSVPVEEAPAAVPVQPQSLAPAPRNFNDLPRFGSGQP